jgi:phosphatidylglycerophosphatase A
MPATPFHKPSFAFMRPKLSRWIAFGFGSGLAPFSPGTVGTLWAWASYLLLDAWFSRIGMPVWLWPAVIAAGLALGIWACQRCGRDLGVSDHGAMVWDEVIAFWLVLWLAAVPSHSGFGTQLALFLLFRFFDILKPPPISHFDATVKGGWGVMLDDLIAAFYTLLVLALWRAF